MFVRFTRVFIAIAIALGALVPLVGCGGAATPAPQPPTALPSARVKAKAPSVVVAAPPPPTAGNAPALDPEDEVDSLQLAVVPNEHGGVLSFMPERCEQARVYVDVEQLMQVPGVAAELKRLPLRFVPLMRRSEKNALAILVGGGVDLSGLRDFALCVSKSDLVMAFRYDMPGFDGQLDTLGQVALRLGAQARLADLGGLEVLHVDGAVMAVPSRHYLVLSTSEQLIRAALVGGGAGRRDFRDAGAHWGWARVSVDRLHLEVDVAKLGGGVRAHVGGEVIGKDPSATEKRLLRKLGRLQTDLERGLKKTPFSFLAKHVGRMKIAARGARFDVTGSIPLSAIERGAAALSKLTTKELVRLERAF